MGVYVLVPAFGKHIHTNIWNTLFHSKFDRFLLGLGNFGHVIIRRLVIGSLVMHNENSLCFRFGDRLDSITVRSVARNPAMISSFVDFRSRRSWSRDYSGNDTSFVLVRRRFISA